MIKVVSMHKSFTDITQKEYLTWEGVLSDIDVDSKWFVMKSKLHRPVVWVYVYV